MLKMNRGRTHEYHRERKALATYVLQYQKEKDKSKLIFLKKKIMNISKRIPLSRQQQTKITQKKNPENFYL